MPETVAVLVWHITAANGYGSIYRTVNALGEAEYFGLVSQDGIEEVVEKACTQWRGQRLLLQRVIEDRLGGR